MHYPSIGNGIRDMKITHVFHNAFEQEIKADHESNERINIGIFGKCEQISCGDDEWDTQPNPSISRFL